MDGLADSQLGIQAGGSAGVWADNPADCPDKPQVIAIVGATATGKSALADALAASLGSELVSADSMQVYRGMDIGTAKTPPAERSVPYHCIDLVDPGEPFTAALYQRHAREAIDGLLASGRPAVLCGGTGLYLRAALDDFSLDEGRDEADDLRSRLQAQADELGAVAFHALLASRDAKSAALIHPNNVRRVVRAFEFLEQGGSYAQRHQGFSDFRAVYPTRFIGIAVLPQLLYGVIERRVDSMIAFGLMTEVEGLLRAGFGKSLSAQQAIGYKELLPVLAGEKPLAEAVAEIKQATRRYAKRQGTWFRRDKRIQWLEASDLHSAVLDDGMPSAEFTKRLHQRLTDLLQYQS
jgi:tRNA dimethylallyltransferase